MIEIDDGFTSISAGYDAIGGVSRAATGARVTVEFRRTMPLAPAEAVRVRHQFAGGGDWREHTGIPQRTRTVVQWGRPVVHHYRLSYWISASAVIEQPRSASIAEAATIRTAASTSDRSRA